MHTISIKVMDEALEITNHIDKDGHAQSRMLIAYNPNQGIGANLENIRVRLAGVDFDVIIVVNPLSYSFSDTIVGLNHQRIDLGLALTNMFNVPVVALPTVNRLGLEAAIKDKCDQASWHLDYYGQYDGKRNYGQEAMLTIGNGYFGMRGAYVESKADENNYPGTYVAGVYNQNTTTINGRDVTNEDLVNLPNAQFMTFGIDHANPFQIKRRDIQDFYRSLDLKTGQLTTTMLVSLSTGHQLRIQTTKVADMQHWHRFGIRYRITPLNFSGALQVYSTIDGDVRNQNVDRYQQFDNWHVVVTGTENRADRVLLTGQTRHSGVQFAIGTRLSSPTTALTGQIKVAPGNRSIEQSVSIPVVAEQTYTFDKTGVIFTSRESKDTDLPQLVHDELTAASFDHTVASTQQFFEQVWHSSDTNIDGDITSQKLLRVNTFHLLVAGGALASGQLDASVGARGLHGEAYRGHVFWDEMFVMPFYTEHAPAIAKNMLMYRFNRLGAAKQYAKDNGRSGAMYPWQSGQTGDEQAQSIHLNPLTNTWDPDNSRRQRHVSLAIAYDTWLYWHITRDNDFMNHYGLIMLLAIAKFWLSMVIYDQNTGCYSIHRVMGPDEFHEGYPNADEPGLTDNAYTNICVAWLFKLIATLQDKAPAEYFGAALAANDLTSRDITKMTDIRHHLHLDVNEDGIIGQFAGYFKLPELNFDNYRKQYGDIARLDRILKSEGKTPDAYQVAKQADTLMAHFILNQDTVTGLIKDMGYELPADYFDRNLQYYLDRTTHGSTLSRIVYAYLDRIAGHTNLSWRLFRQALFSDYYDIQGGTTAEGIHLGVMGATLDVAQRLYGGVNLLDDKPSVNPKLPSTWCSLAFNCQYRNAKLHFKLTHSTIKIMSDHDCDLTVLGKPVSIKANNEFSVDY
ncbi:glycoside hydrolase family 65 protein [Lacticaseibacillus hulanensis]|uniref:glycoside hydrolase family 65 protein n=1 Tax=Lacticaseibacillus hulanensis TaxID=2493111 RepID=UPI000FD9E4BB|nr:glycosyl hydrolase family 65 protein [Lacticaseibacillus hulanensis]